MTRSFRTLAALAALSMVALTSVTPSARADDLYAVRASAATAGIIAFPSGDVPIIQSYVDIFLSGCFELEDAHRLPGFARDCVASTTDWSTHWVNDRVHPRSPLYEQPYADRIDALIKAELPEDFGAIRIE